MLQGIFDQFLFPAPNPPSYSDERPGPWDNSDVVWLRTEKGGYQFPVVVCEPHGLLPQRVVLYCHGNACDVGQAYPSFRAEATRWRALVVLVEYPGYGQSGGRACKEAVDAHVRAAYDHFTTVLQVPPSRVVIFGCSVGTGPASALAARVQASGSSIGALVLLSAYTSIRDAAASLVGAVAYIVLAERWDNAAALRTLSCPVLLLHGTSDEVIPFRQGEQLAELRRKAELPVVFFAQQGGTHNVYRAREDLSDPILAFLQKHHAQARPLVVRSDLGPKRELAVSPPAPSPRRRMPGGCLP